MNDERKDRVTIRGQSIKLVPGPEPLSPDIVPNQWAPPPQKPSSSEMINGRLKMITHTKLILDPGAFLQCPDSLADGGEYTDEGAVDIWSSPDTNVVELSFYEPTYTVLLTVDEARALAKAIEGAANIERDDPGDM